MTRPVLPWLLAIALGWVAVRGQCAQRELDTARQRLDSIRSEELQARTEAQGWRTRLVQETSELERELQEAEGRGALLEDEKRQLAREIETLGGRLAAVMDLYADARGQIVALGEVHGDDREAPDSITAPVDDGLLAGRVAYFPAPQTFDLSYHLSLGLTVAVSEAPDGRGLVTVMPERPDLVSLSYGETLYQRPEPVQHCSVGRQLRTAGYGALGSELVQLLFGALAP